MSAGRYVWLDGNVQLATAAHIPVDDRGLLMGDGVYEGLRAFAGRLLRLREHLDRLGETLAWLRIAGVDTDDVEAWRLRVDDLLAANRFGHRQVRVRITVTRGSSAAALPPPTLKPRVLITAVALDDEVDARESEGIGGWPVPFRRHPDHARHKTLDRIPSVMALVEMRRLGGDDRDEALLTDTDGSVLEGSTSNLFVVRADGALVTPPASQPLLPGITRAIIVELMPDVLEAPVSLDELRTAREAFCTRTSRGVTPIVRVAGQPLGEGLPGPVAAEVRRRYAELLERELG